jgi:signal transduction histidine kinase
VNSYLQQCRESLHFVVRAASRFLLVLKRLLREQLNKNIHTRILFTNVLIFVFGLIALTAFSGYVVKQIAYDQVQQDLLRKAKRVNFALLRQNDQAWVVPPDGQTNDQAQGRQEMLQFLSDIFDTRITIFDRQGNIMDTSAQQEVVPGNQVDAKFVELLNKGETVIARAVDQKTGQLVFVAVVPMGNKDNKDIIKNGILLETNPVNLNHALNKMRLYMVIGGMAILVIFMFISAYLALSISRPISRLATTVAEFNRENYVLNTEEWPMEEINALAGQLGHLAVRLREMHAESRRVEEERAQLFAEVSHELRTPLTSVQGLVEAIRDGMVQDEALLNRYLDTIYTQTIHITRLVDDILALSRLESGNTTVEKLPIDLTTLTQGVVISMEAMAGSKNTSLLFEKKTENAVVLGDVDRMEQIIRNLLKNAVLATENGTVRVGVEVRQGEVVVTIEDDGIGIAPEDLPHIWDRFYQVKNQRGGYLQKKGSGLGLAIVKKLVQLQDGSIDVTSQLGKGTTFNINFPSYNQK